ncbi:MAG: AAA family ATPase [bacterium]|nr:AAA family ATPase [bacterium]
MILKQVRITNFQSIQDSTQFEISDVTCLVGKNEAGKTALLKALYRLNPIRTSDAEFDATGDYPRRDLVDYEQGLAAGTQASAPVVHATYALDTGCIRAIEAMYGENCLIDRNPAVTLRKDYANQVAYSGLQVDHGAAVSHLVANADLPNSVNDTLKCQKTVPNVLEALKDVEKTEASQKLQQRLAKIPDGDVESAIYNQIISQNLPKFLYFDEYYQMKGQDNLDALKNRRDQGSLEEADEPLLGLIELAGLDLDLLTTPGQTEALIARLEAAENQLTNKVLRYWSQNRHLRMKFDVRPAQSEDPPGMKDGMNILGRVEDTRHMLSTALGTRSRGFIWFFSFLAWYSQLRKQGKNIILLLDEPGLSLHAKAQADLLRYFEEELMPHHQLIYTTHSPFMVDATRFDRIRIVQDLSVEEGSDDLPDSKQGTKVFTEVLDATPDSLFPLQGALGYEIHQTLFVGPNCLVVEGASDLLYLQTMSVLLEEQGRSGLDRRWTITPVGGTGKVPMFVALIGAQTHLNVTVLVDSHEHDRQQLDNLYRKKLLKKQQVLTFADFTEDDEADVEDLFSVEFYLRLVNGEFGCAIESADLAVGHPRILRRIEDHLTENPLPQEARFSHYRPARYFSAKANSLAEHLREEDVDRFESVFRAVNALL